MKRLNNHILFLGVLLSYFMGFGQAEILTKEEAFRLMLKNNFNIEIAQNNVEIAENNAGILNSGYLPSLTGSSNATYTNSDSRTEFAGTTDSLGMPVSPREPIVINDAITRRYDASISMNYLLFDGLGRYYNYQILQEQFNLSDLQVRQVMETTTLQLMTIYYQVARLTENLEVFKQTLENTREREKRAKYRFEYGQTNKLEVLNAQVDINTDSINLMNARQQLENSKHDLNVVLNREIKNLSFKVDTVVNLLPELEMLKNLSEIQDNVRLQLAESNVKVTDLDIKTARSLLLPQIGLNGSYGWNRSEEPEGPFFPSTTRTSDALNIGASLSWNIFDGGRSLTGLKNAKIFAENEKLRKKQIKNEVDRDIANAHGNYENALAIYDLQKKNVLTNENNFNRSQEQYKLGRISSVELRQAQVNLINARTTLILSKYDAKLAELQLLQLTGEILNTQF